MGPKAAANLQESPSERKGKVGAWCQPEENLSPRKQFHTEQNTLMERLEAR